MHPFPCSGASSCAHCGRPLTGEDLYCGHCGSSVQQQKQIRPHERARRPPATLRTFLARLGFVIVGVLLLALISRNIPTIKKHEPLPPGWQIIRPPEEVSALAVQSDTVWAGGSGGLFAIDRTNAQLRAVPQCLAKLHYVEDILVDRAGSLWIAHSQGVTRYAHGGCRHFTQADGFLQGPALAVLEDSAGLLWAGYEKGLVCYDGRFARHFTPADGLQQTVVDVIYQDRSGSIWFGSSYPPDGGLTRYDGKQWRRYNLADGLAHAIVNAITEDHTGALWFGTGFGDYGGASRYAEGVWKTWTRSNGLAADKVRCVFEDREQRLWFGSESNGIAVYNGRSWRVLRPADGLAGREVKEVIEDEDGVFWLGTDEGLSRAQGSAISAAVPPALATETRRN